MGKGRLEAFSDGVIAIIITIMVLELKPPKDQTLEALGPLWPSMLGYVLSFVYVGIYWNNHHHLLHTAHRVSGRVLWANLHLLFWMSLMPFLAGWLGTSRFAAWPVAAYGVVLLMCAVAWQMLCRELAALHADHQDGGQAAGLFDGIRLGGKAIASLSLYVLGIGLALAACWIGDAGIPLAWAGCGLYAVVAAIWFIPDRGLERAAIHRTSS